MLFSKVCGLCRREYKVRPSRAAASRFCSKLCSDKGQDRTGRVEPAPIADRFWAKVSRGTATECWEWSGALVKGYGVLTVHEGGGQRLVKAHRISYEMHHGPIPDGLWVLHDCDNKKCVNPAHLHLGDAKQNSKEALERGLLDGRPVPRPDAEREQRIRALHAEGLSMMAIARRMGLRSPGSIGRTLKRLGLTPNNPAPFGG